ncbi:hypothetical protein ACTFIZ_002267 [Dictyostelium cf. discoideum]
MNNNSKPNFKKSVNSSGNNTNGNSSNNCKSSSGTNGRSNNFNGSPSNVASGSNNTKTRSKLTSRWNANYIELIDAMLRLVKVCLTVVDEYQKDINAFSHKKQEKVNELTAQITTINDGISSHQALLKQAKFLKT